AGRGRRFPPRAIPARRRPSIGRMVFQRRETRGEHDCLLLDSRPSTLASPRSTAVTEPPRPAALAALLATLTLTPPPGATEIDLVAGGWGRARVRLPLARLPESMPVDPAALRQAAEAMRALMLADARYSAPPGVIVTIDRLEVDWELARRQGGCRPVRDPEPLATAPLPPTPPP